MISNEKCQYCHRKAKYKMSVRGASEREEDQQYSCGYHTWWSGCPIDKEYRQSLNEAHKISE